MRVFVIRCLICCYLPIVLFGQARTILPRILSTIEGLSDNTNEFMYRDSRGFMWYSSTYGLNRFDGNKVKVYKPGSKANSLNGSNIQSNFFEDTKGNMWFCTHEAINCYRRQSDDFQSFQIIINQQKIESDYYAFALEKNRTLWLLIRGQIIQFDIHNQKIVVLDSKLNYRRAKVRLNENGEVVSILGYKYKHRNIKDLEILTKTKDNHFLLEHHSIQINQNFCRVNDIVFENLDQLWLATDCGVLLYDMKKRRVQSIINTDKTKSFASIFEESKDHLLAVSKKEGIYLINSKKNSIEEHFEANTYSRFLSLTDAYLDTLGNLWVADWTKGITHVNLKKSKFKTFLHSEKESNKVSIVSIVEDKIGKIWCLGEDNKVYVINRTNNQIKTLNIAFLKRETGIPELRDLLCDNLGRILVFSKKAIYVYESTGNLLTVYLFPYNTPILNASILSNNKILLSCPDSLGLVELDYNFKTTILPIGNGFKKESKDILNVYESREGLLFVNLNQERLLILQRQRQSYNLIKQVAYPSEHYVFYEPTDVSNLIWIGTSKGLLKFDKNKLDIIAHIDEEKGLSDQFICGILPLNADTIILSTRKGLITFNTQIAFNTQNYATHIYTPADGLQDEQFNAGAFLKASDQTFWFGGINGLNFFKADNMKYLTALAYPLIVNLKVNDKESSINITEVKEIEFPFSERTLSFDLVAVEYSDPKNNLIQYRLKNHEDNWVTVKNTEGAVRYANLPAGIYYLQAKAANSDGVWNETIRELKITILTPIYQTWWFYTLCFLLIISIIGYIIYLRLSKIFDLQEMKIKLQEKLHDDLGSRLTVIVLMIDEILRSIREGAVVNTNEPLETLTDISQIGSSTVINMRKLLWANDNANDEMSNVLQQINTNKEELYPKIELIVTISENLKTLKIDGNKRYHIISIFDEALINIRKYADATKVKVNFDCKNNWFSMIIQDNGKGFESEKEKEKSALSGREGIRNMINRAKKMNGRLTITSKLKIGTMILLEIPLKETLFFQRLKRIFYTSYLKR